MISAMSNMGWSCYIELWLTIRGYAISKSWMEDYKASPEATTDKKSLRKELKKKNDPKPTDRLY